MGGHRVTIDTSLLKNPEFRCEHEGCGKFFAKLSKLKYHQNTHLPEKPFKCEYSGCKSGYFRSNHLKRHVDLVHKSCSKSPRLFKCPVEGCDAAFETENSWFFHSKRKHFEASLQCSFCDLKFTKKWKHKEHESGHTGANPFKCDVDGCTEEFKDHTTFRAHKRKHEKQAKVELFKCPFEECEESFQKWSELVNHRKISHFIGTQCKICQKTFTQRNLKLHLPIHSEERKTFPCSFDDCPRFYFHLKNLTYHIKVKHNGDGYQCSFCDKKLSSKQRLKQHVEIHHTESGKRSPKKKKTSIKIVPTSDKDWISKKSGPIRTKKNKFACIRFPEATTTFVQSSSQATITDTDTNSETGDAVRELVLSCTVNTSSTQEETNVSSYSALCSLIDAEFS